jgi:voltage-gated potassium channel Kch
LSSDLTNSGVCLGWTWPAARKDSSPPAANPAHVPQPERPLIMRFLTDLTLRRAIGGIVVIATVFTLASAALMLLVEHKTYQNFGEACWWSVQTVSTVGYGDNPPVTPAGRFLATIVMLFGVALVPAITSLVVAVFINQQFGRFRGPHD